MSTLDHLAVSTGSLARESRKGSPILAYCVALPLFGRAVFPMLRDKAHITLASSFTDPQILATYLVAMVVAAKFFTTSNPSKQVNAGRAARVFLVFVAVCLASSFGSRFPLFSIWRCLEVGLLGMWAVVMIRTTARTVDSSSAIRAFYAICVAILIGVFIGLAINPSGAWSIEGDVARLTGTTGYSINPNDIGAIAAILSLACYVRAVERGSVMYAIATALFISICYVSHSRGSYVALAVGFLAATIMLGRLAHRRASVYLTSFAVTLTVGAAALLSPEFRDFFVFLLTRGHGSQNLESFGGRLGVWEFGLQIFTEHPFLGTGYGTYPEGIEGGHFHNIFIELLVTTGLVGVFSYVAFLVAIFRAIGRWIRSADPNMVAERTIAADLVTIPTVILVAGSASAGAAYYSWDLLGLMCVAVASSLAMRRQDTAGEEPEVQMRFSNLLR